VTRSRYPRSTVDSSPRQFCCPSLLINSIPSFFFFPTLAGLCTLLFPPACRPPVAEPQRPLSSSCL
jgi:hypothetical protein